MAPPVLFVAFCTWGEVENEVIVWSVGGGLFLLGLALRIWAQMHLRHRLPIKRQLTLTGPYRYVRNPLYVANTVLLLAATVVGELFWFLPIMLVYCAIIYSLVVRHEEAKLLRKYGGAYEEYRRQVPRWFPRLVGARTPCTVDASRFLPPCLLVELQDALLLLPFLIKELV
jgi:protein-S-isoprenylcysteine O-methyltransferase Ste14